MQPPSMGSTARVSHDTTRSWRSTTPRAPFFGSYRPRPAAGSGTGLFLAKFDSAGTALWVERTTSPNTDTQTYSSGNKVDGLGNSYVNGFFFGTPTFGPGEATQTVLSTANQSAYVAKFNSV